MKEADPFLINFVDFGSEGESLMEPAVAVGYLLNEKYNELTPKEINCGNCDEFAFDLVDLIGGNVLATTEDTDLPAHYFVFHNDRYYDAEVPNGVESARELPIYSNLHN